MGRRGKHSDDGLAGDMMYRPFHQGSVKESAEILATARQFHTVPELKEHLREHLPQNSSQSRSRYTRYVTNRFFSDGTVDKPLTRFAEVFHGTPSLQRVAFYAFCKAEILVRDLAACVLYPCLEAGHTSRTAVEDFITEALPDCGDVPWQANQVFQVLRTFNMAKLMSDHLTVSVWPQPEDLSAFLYILHDLYPEPGMRPVPQLVGRAEIRGVLWLPSTVRVMLRSALNQGYIAKLSSLDNHEHFTTTLTPDQLVERLRP